jgi:hypothetical protein
MYDAGWLQGVARTRGVALDAARAAELARDAAPILERFAAIVAELTADDDPYELRRRLAAEAQA